jgi:thiamine-phosphate pyrophosphorylase
MARVDFALYLVTDRQQTAGRALLPLLDASVQAGLPAIQIRERDLGTRPLLELIRNVRLIARRSGARLFVNDRVDLALAGDIEGVHLRADSLPVSAARRILGPRPLIGVSAHSADDVARAEQGGADFAVLGPVFDTPSKRDYGRPIGLAPIAEAARRCRMPVFAIGGMTVPRVPEVIGSGARGVAVVSSILSAESVSTATRAFLDALATVVPT